MAFSFTFRTPSDKSDLREAIDFLAKQNLGYPGYDSWVQRTEAELDSGYKTAILAYNDRALVGDLIFQPHKQLSRVREIKNIRIHPGIRRRDFAHFMLKQAEIEGKAEFDALICDAREDLSDIAGILYFSGYSKLAQANLYEKGTRDIVLVKIFQKENLEQISERIRKHVLEQAMK
ncbi:MAG: hypothetical protein PHO02_02315 [Candidatus Nanoarchaeia archaeon]|nr:hypothetical protein [Candidatus Nanoarchaeia archaeon]